MKQLIGIGLYDNNQEKVLDWNSSNSNEIATCMEEMPEGTLFVFTGEQSNKNSVIMCPGGGYLQINLRHEGMDFAKWFMDRHITFAVLKYRYPKGNPDIPAEDIRRAMEIMRKRFPSQTEKLGVMGTSIGGYYGALSATLLPEKEQNDFQILLYSVVSMSNELTHLPCRERMFGNTFTPEKVVPYSPIEQITPRTSPAFIVANADDSAVSPLNSINYAAQLQKAGIPISLHIYPSGGHSFGFKDDYAYKQQWLAELDKWLTETLK